VPVIDLLKDYFKIRSRDDLREIREKVTGKLLTLDESLRPTLPALLALLGASGDDGPWRALDPGERRQRTLEAVRRLLLREARSSRFFSSRTFTGLTRRPRPCLTASLKASRRRACSCS
jgi:hypothetical protein